VDALIASTTTNKQYTQEEKQVRIERYRDLYQQVPRCIPGEEIP
jgi:HJR/Mrr/RecB family endonuclease